jgi:ubiquinone/menaquinone biosynthesis C-methylase UbiE
VSSYVYMKVLESTPQRYDRGIHMLSGGAIERVYERIAALAAAPGKSVLDVGCGTGNVSLACAARGADVVGIDIDAGMLEVARAKARAGDYPGQVELIELGAMEIEDRFEPESFDGVVSCLVFSELSGAEQDYVLATVRTRLRPGGVLVIADEVAPSGRAQRAWWRLRRAPLVAVTWLVTQTGTHWVRDLDERVRRAGFADVHGERFAGNFGLVRATAPEVSS